MTTKELSKLLNHYLDIGALSGDESVLITLSSPSVGARASCEVVHAGIGFDWEHGQFRLSPSTGLVKWGTSKDNIVSPRVVEFNNKKYFHCAICEERLTKEQKYCGRCGQRAK